MSVANQSWQIIHDWEGNLNSRTPAGWLTGTSLERDLQNDPNFRVRMNAVRRVAIEEKWSRDEAVAVAREVTDMATSGIGPKSLDALYATIRGTYTAARDPLLIDLSIKAGLIEPYGSTDDGLLIRALEPPWRAIRDLLRKDPDALLRFDPRALEELIAASYDRAGYDEVILTPRSGDHGRDVIATKRGVLGIRIFDQVKARGPGHIVTAHDVRALLGVVMGSPNVSKGVFTTTSSFAPRLLEDPSIGPNVPNRLELRPRSILVPWLQKLE